MQKLIFLILMIGNFPIIVNAQHIVVANVNMNVVYLGLNNPIEVAVSNYPKEAIIVSVDNGVITGENGNYIWKPKIPGLAVVKVSIKKETRVIELENINYRVKRIPTPIARVGNKASCSIGSVEFKFQLGVMAWIDNFELCERAKVSSFEFRLEKNSGDNIMIKNYGSRFNKEILAVMQRLQKGDIVYIENVYAITPGEEIPQKINSLVFKIK